MSNKPIIERIAPPLRPEQNVQGWERIGSLAGGLAMMGKGIRRGGLLGVVQLAIGGAVLARGITGHCSAKALAERGRTDLDIARANIRRAGAQLSELKNRAEVAAANALEAKNDPQPKA